MSANPSCPTLAALMGPTGVGKTAASLELARRAPIEVISCDSMAIYRGLDIGTSKPTAEEQAQVTHHLIDCAHPNEDFDAGRFAELACEAIADISGRGRIPLVVGGTGFWLRALSHGLAAIPAPHPAVRAALHAQLESEGLAPLASKLLELDPKWAQRVGPHDTQRTIRGLEVVLSTGTTLSEWQQQHQFGSSRFALRAVVLNRDRAELYRRIDSRAAAMVNAGLVEETRRAIELGVSPSARTLSTPGYREVVAHLRGELGWRELPQAVAQAHRRYAKRQLTWFRGQLQATWLQADDFQSAAEALGL